ncbi:TPA: hypothetical protein ACHK8U_004915, partial [Escherichia coli]
IMQNLILKNGNEELVITDETFNATAYMLGITPTELKKHCDKLFKSADEQKPTMQDLIKAKAEQIKQSKKGNY